MGLGALLDSPEICSLAAAAAADELCLPTRISEPQFLPRMRALCPSREEVRAAGPAARRTGRAAAALTLGSATAAPDESSRPRAAPGGLDFRAGIAPDPVQARPGGQGGLDEATWLQPGTPQVKVLRAPAASSRRPCAARSESSEDSDAAEEPTRAPMELGSYPDP